MRQPLDTIPSDPVLPAAADVVVSGGGIAGTSTAYWLARRGVLVALLEKGQVGAEQSSRNWGWCRQAGRGGMHTPSDGRAEPSKAVPAIAADLLTGATPIVDPTPFRYGRMIDGIRLRPNAGV